jgi:molybdopterin-guanine dinucleotide biosynthesis protein
VKIVRAKQHGHSTFKQARTATTRHSASSEAALALGRSCGLVDIRDFDISKDGIEVVLERMHEPSDVVLIDFPRP